MNIPTRKIKRGNYRTASQQVNQQIAGDYSTNYVAETRSGQTPPRQTVHVNE